MLRKKKRVRAHPFSVCCVHFLVQVEKGSVYEQHKQGHKCPADGADLAQ